MSEQEHDQRPPPPTTPSQGGPGQGTPSQGGPPHTTPQGDNPHEGQRVVVVTQDGMGVGHTGQDDEGATAPRSGPRNPADMVEQPDKVMRLGTMIKQLLEEVRSAPLDEAGRHRLAEIHRRSIRELEDGLSPELVQELERITLPLSDGAPSDAELRIAQAQLVGWLEGLFHGIQTAIVAQQMAAQAQLQRMRRALPPGSGGPGPGATGPLGPGQTLRPGQQETGEGDRPTGQYL